jgi:hypothetical protein
MYFQIFFLAFFIILSGWDSPLCTAATIGLLHQPQMIGDGDCGAIGGMKTGRGNRSTRRKPTLVPLCPPQIPHDLTRARTRTTAVGNQQLTAWAMTRPYFLASSSSLRKADILDMSPRSMFVCLSVPYFNFANCSLTFVEKVSIVYH